MVIFLVVEFLKGLNEFIHIKFLRNRLSLNFLGVSRKETWVYQMRIGVVKGWVVAEVGVEKGGSVKVRVEVVGK